MAKKSKSKSPEKPQSKKYIAGLSLAAAGIVFGDIGTSVLYAFRESFHPSNGIAPTPENVLGILSLIIWSLILVISVKYLIFILRADIDGEGGVLVLTELITPHGKRSKKRGILIMVGLFGAALLYGDSTITPAITVLSAIEGLNVATTFFEPYIIPITIGILFALFFFQKHGTANIGKVFGPIMVIWFVTIGAIGVYQLVQAPQVLAALNPVHAIDFFIRNGIPGFLVLGSVVLAVTGGEALYADIGHFGVLPVRIAWYGLILPGLILNYFGQGAFLLQNPDAFHHPFFMAAPGWALYPLVALATAAAIIASQAVITGAFSLTRQAMQFEYSPRMRVEQTSSKESGQIYMPAVNWTMMVVTIALVLGFRNSSNLAAAYGMAVTSTMLVTTFMFSVLVYKKWNWSIYLVIPFAVFFLIIDLSFFAGNIPKIPHGGWFPLVIAGIIFIIMTTWKKGRKILRNRISSAEMPLEKFMKDVESYADVEERKIKRVDGTAVYMYSNPEGTPPALLHNIKHNHVIHKDVVLLSVKTNHDRPYVHKDEQIEIESLGSGFYRIILYHGFAQGMNIPRQFKNIDEPGLNLKIQQTTFFLGSERIIASDKKTSGMAKWRDQIFSVMVRNQQRATAFFGLPTNRVIEMGAEMEL